MLQAAAGYRVGDVRMIVMVCAIPSRCCAQEVTLRPIRIGSEAVLRIPLRLGAKAARLFRGKAVSTATAKDTIWPVSRERHRNRPPFVAADAEDYHRPYLLAKSWPRAHLLQAGPTSADGEG